VPQGTEPVVWGNVELVATDPCGETADRDADGLRALPDPAQNEAPWTACAATCGAAFGSDAVASCTVGNDDFDCDDDTDGQPDVTEPFACVSLCGGTDLDGDGVCAPSDPFPSCADNIAAAASCSGAEEHEFSPPAPLIGSSCASTEECEDALFCVDNACARGCAADLPCAAGQACVARDDGSFEGACLALTDDVPDGAACADDRECASGACLGACLAVCQVGGACPSADERCTLQGLRHVCALPLDDRAAGEACSSSLECASGTCVIAPGDDVAQAACADACSNDIGCGQGEVCVRLTGGGRACLTPLADGAVCQANGACAGGHCVLDIDDTKKCASECPPPGCAAGFVCQEQADVDGNDLCLPLLDTRASGADCTSERQCASGHCAHFAAGADDFGTLCADPCDAAGQCEAPLVCWADPEGTDVCGPAP
jgi:hypothetical protein